MMTRREFLDGAVAGAAGLAISSTAKSYSRIIGSNNRLNFAVIGLNGRAYAHLSSLKANKANAHPPTPRKAAQLIPAAMASVTSGGPLRQITSTRCPTSTTAATTASIRCAFTRDQGGSGARAAGLAGGGGA